MRTVPAGAASALLAQRPDVRAQLAGCGRLVGTRAEVDLQAAGERAGPSVAAALEAFARDTEALWSDLTAGRRGRRYMVTSAMLADHVQVTSKVGRADLAEVFEVLDRTPATRAVLRELTNPDVDAGALRTQALAAGGDAFQDEDGSWVAHVPVDGPLDDVLGGARHPAQISRVVELTARHAKWRDRRVRRLARVVVRVEQMWADPERALELLAA